MSAAARLSRISRQELLVRLAEGHAARLSVVTPNQRLAAALARDFGEAQAARGFASWEAADILPFSAFIERLYEDALYSELATRLPILLTPEQEQALWEQAIKESGPGKSLLAVSQAAALAREAWTLAHAWGLAARAKDFPGNDDAKAFTDWAGRFEDLTRRGRHCDRARLAGLVASHLAHPALRKPATLIAVGFDILTPQQRDFLAVLGEAGTQVLECARLPRSAQVRRVAFASGGDEIHAAARWARARLDADARSRIGIVVPDITQSRCAVRRIFTQVMEPAHGLSGEEIRRLPFNLSLGQPLPSYPLAAAAFLAIDLAGGEIEFSRASRLVRSPFVAGAEAELAARARLDAELRKVCGPRTGLESVRRAIEKLTASGDRTRAFACPILARLLSDLSGFAKQHLSGSKPAGEWAKLVSLLLDALGFPGERGLDSDEYQTLNKWHEALARFAALGRVAGRMRFAEARSRLARIAADTLFQPEAPEVPIQVLGVLESAGLEFDHLWVTGLTDEAWPIPARPNPFIPVALQRAAGVPESSASASLELDARITRGWINGAKEVVLSHALREDDRELAPSPLIREFTQSGVEDLALPEVRSLRDAIRRVRREERMPDERAPGLMARGASPGGTGVFRDQAACPFRAFATHRLGAEGLEAPGPGPDAADRGNLVHAMLAKAWRELKSKAQLDAASDGDLDALVALAADTAINAVRWRRPGALEGRLAELERERLAKLGRAWLEFERARPSFEVAAIERKRAVSFGGVTVNAKLDRMDHLEGAGRAIIDYKTGSARVGDWLGPRPDDPQLPIYAMEQSAAAGEDIAALAFARVKAGEMEFRGIARAEGLIPGVETLDKQRSVAAREYSSWTELLASWRSRLDALGREFAAGEARVGPKHGEETCRHCGLKSLCRVNERSSSIGDEGE